MEDRGQEVRELVNKFIGNLGTEVENMINHIEGRMSYKEIIDFLDKYKDVDSREVKTKLKEWRVRRGIELYHFEEVGLKEGNVRMLEKVSYEYKPSLESLIKYCYVVGIKLSDVL